MQHAKNEWIAFLDADDYYLEDRFKYSYITFESPPEIDAVGEPVGAVFHDEKGKNQYLKHLNLSANTLTSDLIIKVNMMWMN
ncbi:MAG: glycosyltransferase family 2 protein [Saprospiraceae bacterium]|nr:glycosyltransferase family 2 protein [Saprospiraceae bacterium]